jgi:hypothetical protein
MVCMSAALAKPGNRTGINPHAKAICTVMPAAIAITVPAA